MRDIDFIIKVLEARIPDPIVVQMDKRSSRGICA